MCLALRASGLWLRYAALQNLIPSFPWIVPHTLHPGAIQGKEGIKFCYLATLTCGRHKRTGLRWGLPGRGWEGREKTIIGADGSSVGAFTSLSLNSPPSIDELQIGKFGCSCCYHCFCGIKPLREEGSFTQTSSFSLRFPNLPLKYLLCIQYHLVNMNLDAPTINTTFENKFIILNKKEGVWLYFTRC